MSKVILTQGVSGSGKSTFIKAHCIGAVVCSADHYFMVEDQYVYDRGKIGEAHNQCMRNFVSALLADHSLIVVDNTHVQRWEMSPYAALARAYGYEVEIHTFIVDPAVAFKRNSHNVPWEVTLRAAMSLESPLPTWGRHVTHLPDGSVLTNHLDDPQP